MRALAEALVILLAIVVRGGITFYYGPTFEGQPLYCGGTYDEATAPWVALPVEWYETGQAHCGDLIWVKADSWDEPIVARALDAGYLSHYRIYDSGLPFVADLPKYGREGRPTGTGWLINLSAWERAEAQGLWPWE